MSPRKAKHPLLFASAFALLLVSGVIFTGGAGNLHAQALTAQISGTVQDPTGTLVPNAPVELINTGTAQKREAITDTAGSFVFAQLLPGTYRVRVAAPGFKASQQDNIILSAAERLVLRQITLQLGEVSESVTVAGEAARVQTQSAERAGLIDRVQIESVPVKGRDVMDIVRLLPGVVDTGGHDAPGIGSSSGMNINGARSRTINVAFDGVSANDVGNQQGPLSTPNIDTVAEVKVLLSNYQAEYGRSSGGTIQLVTKNGTRDFHGGVSYFKRNEFFNANNWRSNQLSQPRPQYRYDYPNVNLGGPVIIPGTGFNKNRDKLFFFWSLDYLPRTLPTGPTPRTFPTELERNGDFSQTLDTNGVVIPILDPLNNRLAFPQNKIPSQRFDAGGRGLLLLLPGPNAVDPAHTFNHVIQGSRTQKRFEHLLRLDYNISSKTTVYARGTDGYSKDRGDFSFFPASSSWGQMGIQFYLPTQFLSTGVIHTFSPTLVNEFTFGASRAHSQTSWLTQETLDRNDRVKLGLPIPQLNPQSNPYHVVPNATFGGVQNAPAFSIENRFPYYGTFNTYVTSDSLSKIYNRHNFKTGIYIEKVSNNKVLGSNFNGTFDFGRNTLNPVDTNYAFSNALIGSVNQYSEVNRRPFGHGRNLNVEWFAQDSWRITSRLTLDIGVRFYKIIPPSSPGDQLAAFDPALYDTAKSPQLIQPFLQGNTRVGRNPVTGEILPVVWVGALAPGTGQFFQGMRVFNDKLQDSAGIQVTPRFGFAYDVFGNGKMAVRGGFGTFTDLIGVDDVLNFQVRPPVTVTPTINYTTIKDLLTAPQTFTPQTVQGIDTRYHPPQMYNWSLTVQRDVGFKTIVDVSYVGTVGRHLQNQLSLNAIPYGTNFKPSSIDTTLTGNRPLPVNFLRPYRGFGDITFQSWNMNTNYHSLQTQANRRFSRGLTFGLAWTWSKAMGYANTGEVLNPFLDWRMRNYGKMPFDRTHNLVFNYRYETPKISNYWKNTFTRLALDNWEIAGITSMMSGSPSGLTYTLVSGADITGASGSGVDSRVDLIGNVVLPKSEQTVARMFNTDMVRSPDPAKFGIGNAPKDVFRGPGINNWDITLAKNWPWGPNESRNVQFRFETYNTFNHTQFSTVDNAARFDAAGKQTNTLFGSYTGARDPRRVQMGLKIRF